MKIVCLIVFVVRLPLLLLKVFFPIEIIFITSKQSEKSSHQQSYMGRPDDIQTAPNKTFIKKSEKM